MDAAGPLRYRSWEFAHGADSTDRTSARRLDPPALIGARSSSNSGAKSVRLEGCEDTMARLGGGARARRGEGRPPGALREDPGRLAPARACRDARRSLTPMPARSSIPAALVRRTPSAVNWLAATADSPRLLRSATGGPNTTRWGTRTWPRSVARCAPRSRRTWRRTRPSATRRSSPRHGPNAACERFARQQLTAEGQGPGEAAEARAGSLPPLPPTVRGGGEAPAPLKMARPAGGVTSAS